MVVTIPTPIRSCWEFQLYLILSTTCDLLTESCGQISLYLSGFALMSLETISLTFNFSDLLISCILLLWQIGFLPLHKRGKIILYKIYQNISKHINSGDIPKKNCLTSFYNEFVFISTVLLHKVYKQVSKAWLLIISRNQKFIKCFIKVTWAQIIK